MGRLLCRLGLHRWAYAGEELRGYTVTDRYHCRRPGCRGLRFTFR